MLRRIHLASLGINILFLILRFIIFRSSCTRSTYFLYCVLSAPEFVIQFWLEKIGRPTHGSNGELKKAGEDLEAKGLTEYMLDVLYWSFATTFVASLLGDIAFWMWAAIPVYSAWLAYSTFGSMRNRMAGLTAHSADSETVNAATSNRQKKLEKRGTQKVQYR